MLSPAVRFGFDSVAARVVLPLILARAGGAPAWVVVLESSDAADAARRGAVHVPALATLRGTPAVQAGRWQGDTLVLAAGVDFSADRVVTPGTALPFPPSAASPGSVGQPGYRPFVELPDGTVLNAPVVADERHVHDRVTVISRAHRWAAMRVTRGYGASRTLWYVSTEASDPMVAAIEAATWVPGMAEGVPASGKAMLVAMVNGPTLAEDSLERHGMHSAMRGEGDPQNILEAIPAQARYAPLWELHMAMWTPRASAEGARIRLLSVDEVNIRRGEGLVVGMGEGGALASTGILVNCPVLALR